MAQPTPLEYLVISGTRKEMAQRLNDASQQGYLLLSSSCVVLKEDIIMTCVMVINRNIVPQSTPTKTVDAQGQVHDVQ